MLTYSILSGEDGFGMELPEVMEKAPVQETAVVGIGQRK
jgi:hypothetical protein